MGLVDFGIEHEPTEEEELGDGRRYEEEACEEKEDILRDARLG